MAKKKKTKQKPKKNPSKLDNGVYIKKNFHLLKI